MTDMTNDRDWDDNSAIRRAERLLRNESASEEAEDRLWLRNVEEPLNRDLNAAEENAATLTLSELQEFNREWGYKLFPRNGSASLPTTRDTSIPVDAVRLSDGRLVRLNEISHRLEEIL